MDLFGWDIVCACALPKLNQLLVAQFAQTPAAVAFQDDSGTSFTAQFAPWATHLDDATKKIQFLLPIHSGSLMLNGGPNSVDLAGVTLLVQLDLAFVSNVSSASDLQFNLQMKGADENDTTPGAVFVVNPDTTGVLKTRDSSGQVAQTLHDLLPLCLIQNKAKLAYVLNRLNLTPTQGWPAPQCARFAFINGASFESSSLAVFSMLSATDSSKLPLQIDPALTTGTGDLAIAFAKNVFLEHVILPQLPAAYSGTSAGTFTMNGDGSQIVNTGAINSPPYKYGLIYYDPVISSLSIGIAAAQITTQANGSFDITGLSGASVSFSVSTVADCRFDAPSRRLILSPSGSANVNHETDIPWYDYVAALPVLPFMGPIVGGIVVGIVDGVIAGVSAGVAGAGDSNMQSNSGQLALAQWGSAVIEWPGSNQWTVLAAALSDAFMMQCQLGPVTAPVAPGNTATPQYPEGIRVHSNRCDVASWFGGGG